LVFNVSDLFPASAVELGVVRNSALVRLATWLEEFIYQHSDAITGQTQGIVQDIHTRFPQKPVVLITNGADVEAFSNASASGSGVSIRREFGTEGRFVVGYAGLHGLAQGLETVIGAAQILLPYPEIVFTFFGDGPEKARLMRMAEELHLTNTRFYPTQPRQRMPGILAGFDVSLIPLKRLKLFTGALPSKMFEAMAAVVHLILSVDGEARSLLEAARAGIYVEPENPPKLAEGILRLYRDPEYRKQLGPNGRKYVADHYDRKHIAKKFEQLLLERL
jgi:glycosyltransferase involved in cell wall biosynthesis